MKAIKAIIVWTAILATTALCMAAPVVSVDAGVDKSDVTVGDEILYTITVRHEEGAKIEIPRQAEKLGDFLIREIKSPAPRREDGMIVEQVIYKIATYITGEVTAPAVKIAYSYKDDSGAEKTEEIETDAIVVKVHAVAPEDAKEIRGIKEPVDIPVGWRYYAGWAAILGSIITGALAAYLYYRRRKRVVGEVARSLEPPRPAHEVALEKLDRIEAMNLIAEGRIILHYDLVTEALRAYLGSRYTINALDMTTTELIRALKGVIRETDALDSVSRLLNDADMVKFAKFAPDPESARDAIKTARAVVERTMPRTIAVESGGVAA